VNCITGVLVGGCQLEANYVDNDVEATPAPFFFWLPGFLDPPRQAPSDGESEGKLREQQ
jgi:hypothetical protein